MFQCAPDHVSLKTYNTQSVDIYHPICYDSGETMFYTPGVAGWLRGTL